MIPRSGKAPGEGNGNQPSILAWETPGIEEPGGLQPAVAEQTYAQGKGPGFGGWQTRVCAPPPLVTWPAWSLGVSSAGGGGADAGCGGAGGGGRAENRQPMAEVVSSPSLHSEPHGSPEKTQRKLPILGIWLAGRVSCQLIRPLDSGKRRPPWPAVWPAGPLTQWLGQKARCCLALGRGCSSQRRQQPGDLAGARCRLLSPVQGLPPWTRRDAWGHLHSRGATAGCLLFIHPAGLFCGVGSSQVSGKCAPETQSELGSLLPGPGLHGSGSCVEPYGFCPLAWKVRSPGLELFLKRFLRSPRLTWREYRERSICSVLLCICTLSCIHYLTSLRLGRGSRAECGSSMSLPEPCGELS